MATEQDVLDLDDHHDILCELVDGILVEKPRGWYESTVAQILGQWLQNYLDKHRIGLGLGPDAPLRILGSQERLPDVSFVKRERVKQIRPRRGTIPPLVPDLAVEVLSESNTRKEMDRKLREYFQAGTELVWVIDPESRSATVYTAVDQSQHVSTDGTLDGGNLLPNFSVSLPDLFTKADEQAELFGDDEHET
jgi:Uma2 family endonuclease